MYALGAIAGATLLIASLFGRAATAAPGEDGAHPDPPTWYDSQFIAGWETGGFSDRIYDIAQIGNTVYVAGSFTELDPPTGPDVDQAYIAAFDAATGTHVALFDPVLNGPVFSLAVAEDGSKLYAGGLFTTVDGQHKRRLVALDPLDGSVIPGWDTDVTGGSVRTVIVRGNDLYLGGAFTTYAGQIRTRLAKANATTGALDPTWAPSALGDRVFDIDISTAGGRVYVGGQFSSIDLIPGTEQLAALDQVTGDHVPAFDAPVDREVFDLVAADDGRVWTAQGDVFGLAAMYESDGSVGGLWPTAGDVFAVEIIGERVYFGGHDFGPDEDKVVGLVDPDNLAAFDTTSFDPGTFGGDGTWTFHATGSELWVGGNYGTPFHGFARFTAAPSPEPDDLVPAGATWRYLDDGSDQGAAWRQPAFNDSSWAQGGAQLGFGDGDETTEINDSGEETYWFRHQFNVGDADAVDVLELSLLVDDGAVVWLNGVEALRDNMPGGTIDADTFASEVRFGEEENAYRTFAIAENLLVDGTNTLAIEIHQATPTSSDVGLDAQLIAHTVLDDTEEPTVPTNLSAPTVTEAEVDLTWDPSTDNVAVHHYDVFQDTALVQTTVTQTAAISGLAASTDYTFEVEAVDGVGNRSGLSAPLPVRTADSQPGLVTAIPKGAAWRYLDDGSNQAGAWRQPGFDDSAWPIGPAELGANDGDEATGLAVGPVTHYLRRTFSASAGITDADLALLADDGAVVYLNGTEVVRDNLPGGPVTYTTAASSYRWGAAESTFNPFVVPLGPLVEGANTIAVELHQAPGSIDASFDLELVLDGAAPDETPPSKPTDLTATDIGPDSASLSWTASPEPDVDRYEVFVDGDAVLATSSTTAGIGGLTPSTSYSIQVEAIDGAENRSGLSTPPLGIVTDPATADPVTLIPTGSPWRYLDDGSDQGTAWRAPGFNDNSWADGPAELGLGDGDEDTEVAPGPVTYYYRITFTGVAGAQSLTLDLLADDGAVVYLNGTEVARDNLPGGSIDYLTNASTYRWGAAERTFGSFVLPVGELLPGTNTIAVEIHQAPGSTDSSFDLGLTAQP